MTRDEAARLGFALRAGYETTSNSEYFIRTGLPQSALREIAAALIAGDSSTEIPLIPGDEEAESPRSPGPPI